MALTQEKRRPPTTTPYSYPGLSASGWADSDRRSPGPQPGAFAAVLQPVGGRGSAVELRPRIRRAADPCRPVCTPAGCGTFSRAAGDSNPGLPPCRDGAIRTHGPFAPNEVRCQAALHPVEWRFAPARALGFAPGSCRLPC